MHAWIGNYCPAQLYRNLEFRAQGPVRVSNPTSSLYRLGKVRPREGGQPMQGHTARAGAGLGHRPRALFSLFHSLPCCSSYLFFYKKSLPAQGRKEISIHSTFTVHQALTQDLPAILRARYYHACHSREGSCESERNSICRETKPAGI